MKYFIKKSYLDNKSNAMLSNSIIVNCKNKHYKAGGIPLFSDGKKMNLLNDDTHSVVIGSTGSMKTTRVGFITAISLIRHGESLFVFDPKEEFYPRLKEELQKYNYDTYIINCREPMKGNRFNPLSCAEKAKANGYDDKSNELIRNVASILYNELAKQTTDIFWTKKSEEYFSGLASILRDYGKQGDLTFENIRYLHTLGNKKKSGLKTNLEIFSEEMDKLSESYANVSGTIFSPNDTKASIHSVFTTPLSLFDNEGIKDMMCGSDFELDDLGKKKTAIFLITPDEKEIYNLLVSMIIKLAYESLISLAYENFNGVLPIRVNFILDEFCNLPEIPDFNSMISASRSRNIRFYLFMQSYSQLENKYGKQYSWNILNNCGVWILLRSKEYEFNKMVSDLCGTMDTDYSGEKIPYISPDDIQNLDKSKGEVFVIHNGRVYKTILPFIDEYGLNLKNKNYKREKDRAKKFRTHFDIAKYVDEMLKKRLEIEMREVKSEHEKSTNKFQGIKENELLTRINRKFEELEKQERESNYD